MPDAWRFNGDPAGTRPGGEDAERLVPEVRDSSPSSPPSPPLPPTAPSGQAGSASPRIYDAPTLRPCERIEPERDELVRVGLVDAYGALLDDLPLRGAAAMRPTPGGGIAIVERLREAMPWMEAAIARLERQLRIALWAGRPWVAFRPLCLVGPPGCGKSHFAREVARLAGLGHAALDMGAMSDAAALVAVSRGWTNAKPCWPAHRMATDRCANPLLALDEIEKAGGSRRNGDPVTALLGMLEPSTAMVYHDTCLLAEVDLSAVCWIATANDVSRLPSALLSRLDVVEAPAPGIGHFDVVLAGLLASMAARWRVPIAQLPPLPARATATLRSGFAARRSVRWLGRALEAVVASLVPVPRRDLH